MFSMIYWFILNNTLKQTKYLYIILYIIVTFILIYKILHTVYFLMFFEEKMPILILQYIGIRASLVAQW